MDSRRTTAILACLIFSAACNQSIEPAASATTAEVQVAPIVQESTADTVAIAGGPETTATVERPPVAPPGSPVVRENALPVARNGVAVSKPVASEAARADLASTIMDPSRFSNPDVRETYQNAKLVAERLDEMYCYCKCKENEGLRHKSLLTCFQSEHAAECGICLNESKQAVLDFKDGMPVGVTKKAVDLMYNQGNPPSPHVH